MVVSLLILGRPIVMITVIKGKMVGPDGCLVTYSNRQRDLGARHLFPLCSLYTFISLSLFSYFLVPALFSLRFLLDYRTYSHTRPAIQSPVWLSPSRLDGLTPRDSHFSLFSLLFAFISRETFGQPAQDSIFL